MARYQALKKANLPTPTGQQVRALLDTGASATCIDPSVVAALGIPPHGTCLMNTPTTGAEPQTVNLYDVGLGIAGSTAPPLVFETVEVAESNLLQAQGFHMLIGRDILARCTFYYHGPASVISISY
jgi:hypothetical protein